jgi:cytochrome c556
VPTYHYFGACGFVSEPFQATDLDAAVTHVEQTFRNPANPDFDDDDGGILGQDDDWWDCLTTFIGDTDHNPDNAERLNAATNALTGPNQPTPGAP